LVADERQQTICFTTLVTAQASWFRGAEAACSVHGSPSGWRDESDLSDFTN